MYGNLSTGEIPQPDAIADCVFASHFFEHLTRTEGCHFLKECLRVLKPGGKIRIIVPDLEGAARCYLRELELEVKAGRSQNKQCSGDKFMGGLFVCGPRRRWWVPADWYQAFHDYHRHFWMYDRQSLAAVAADAGFCEIKVGVAREKSEAPDIAEVERNEATGEDGLGFSLEGTKPYRL